MKHLSVVLCLLSLLLVTGLYSSGQEQSEQGIDKTKVENDTITEKYIYKNTISFNITNPSFISTKFLYLTYERQLKNNQSFSVSVGTFSLPKFIDALDDSLNLNTDYKDKGLHLAFDYRFYLKKLNKYNAPRGVHVGPYYTYNYLSRENNWYLDTNDYSGDLITNLDISIYTIGAQLGYQFVFWERLAVDCIMLGPGLGFYSFKTKLGTTLSPEDEALFYENLNEALADKFPGYDYVIDSGEYKTRGTSDVLGAGFRYVINVGFCF